MERAGAAGARPFEVITGAPHGRYGARITFETTEDVRDRAASDVGLSTHPWGAPDWIGLRVLPDGDVVWKAYHRFDRVASAVTVPHALRDSLVPVMASRHQGMDELYFRRGDAIEWVPFVDGVCNAVRFDTAHGGDGSRQSAVGSPAVGSPAVAESAVGSLGTADCQLPTAVPQQPAFRPLPRAHANSFCLSVKLDHDSVTALSFFADDRALPDDRDIAAEWSASLDADDRAAYDAALAGVRALGPRPGRGWHAMLAWTLDRRHGWSRAASLRLSAVG